MFSIRYLAGCAAASNGNGIEGIVATLVIGCYLPPEFRRERWLPPFQPIRDFRMSVDHATVRKIARLARIKLKDEEVAPLAGELNSILHWIEQLNAVDTSSVDPLASTVNAKLPWRKDVVSDGGYQEKILANAPEGTQGFFAVPKVVE